MAITYEELKKANEGLKILAVKGKDYVQVTERVKAFRSLFPEGTIETTIIRMDGEAVVMKAVVSNGEQVLATGLAMEKESASYINKTSYIENCETSAVGRALGFLGIGIDASMASAEELVNAITQQEAIKQQEKSFQCIGEERANILRTLLMEKGVEEETILKGYNVSKLEDLNEQQHGSVVRRLNKSSGGKK